MSDHDQQPTTGIAGAGLPHAQPHVEDKLRNSGIDPDRLSIFQFGLKAHLHTVPPWAWQLGIGVVLWMLTLTVEERLLEFSAYALAALELLTGLTILMAACGLLVTATERLAARFQWNHYSAGTLAEILSTIPELVVIAFIIPVSPVTAFTISIVTIYNNSLVFSLYSYFLPKDRYGKFVMPVPITEAGTQILIGGGAMGLVLGLVMLALNDAEQSKNSFNAVDLVLISTILLAIFAVYLFKLLTSYAQEESEVRENLAMSSQDIEQRLSKVYEHIQQSSFTAIIALFLVGVAGAFIGGHAVSRFAAILISDLQINPILTALILAGFAGMSEYIILWQSHRRHEYGIALANAFGGITQVMFLVLPYTLLGIAVYQSLLNPQHPELPLGFSLPNTFLLLFLFPTFYTLSSLLEEDHTLGILDTSIMTGIFLFLIILLVTYGGV